MDESDQKHLRNLLDDYLRMYAGRDDRLTTYFSENFSGFTGGGDFLVKTREEWVAITRQDFAQVKDPIRIELKDLAIQSLTETIAVATSFFSIHLPIKDDVLSKETARLVLIYRKESDAWKITHSSISIPYHGVREGEVYPLKDLKDRNQQLEDTIAERTAQLSVANNDLVKTNQELEQKIAEHKAAEEALQRSEERYRSILQASPDDITITDLSGRILMASPMAFIIFGYERGYDFQKHSIMDFIVPEDRERARSRVADRLRGVLTAPSEYHGIKKDGTIIGIEVNTDFIRDPKGAPTGMVVIVRDISERKQAEAEKEKLEAQNRQLQKAESLGRMAGAIAHHFNNQLHAVMMGLELAIKDMPEGAHSLVNMKMAMQSAKEAAEVSSLMLTYLGQTMTQRESLDLSKVCMQSLSLLRAVTPECIYLETALLTPGPIIEADTNQIQHALANLITNAWEASVDTRGIIRLSVSKATVAEISTKHRFPINQQPRATIYACLEVSDSGCGIPSQEIEKIFDPFYSTKFPGRGMGLAVVLGVIRTLDGLITVDSSPGKGSTFRIFIPSSA